MNIASYIDHTVLKPETTLDQVLKVCEEAKTHGFAAVCIPPFYVRKAASAVAGTSVKVATVIGFPLGYNHTETKLEETMQAISSGAAEIDMVMNIAAFKSGQLDVVKNDIQRIFNAVKARGVVLKVIIETALLNKEEITTACKICSEVGVNFVKTSTGFSHSGAVLEEVKLMRSVLTDPIKIKASGGIKTKEQAIAFIEAGADRLGCSASLNIIGVE